MKWRERKLFGSLFYAFILGNLIYFFIVLILMDHQLRVKACIRLGDTILKKSEMTPKLTGK